MPRSFALSCIAASSPSVDPAEHSASVNGEPLAAGVNGEPVGVKTFADGVKKGLLLSLPRLAAMGGMGRGTGGEEAARAPGCERCERWRCEDGKTEGCEGAGGVCVYGCAGGASGCEVAWPGVNGCAGGDGCGGGDGRCEWGAFTAGRGSRPKRGLDPSGCNNLSGGDPTPEPTRAPTLPLPVAFALAIVWP